MNHRFTTLPATVRNLLFLALLAWNYRSEAFASSHSRFAGIPLSRGKSSRHDLQCVMQLPRSSTESSSRNGKRKELNLTPADYVAETKLPTDIGQFQLRAYRIRGAAALGQEPCVIYSRDKPPFGSDGKLAEHVPVRIHDQCLTSEVFRSQRYVRMQTPRHRILTARVLTPFFIVATARNN